MNRALSRWLLGLALPALVLAIAYGPLLAYRSELPARFASHFSLSGVPDDSMTARGFVVVMSLMTGLGLAVCVGVALYKRRTHPAVCPLVAFNGAFVGGLGALILALSVVTQRGLTDWREAEGPGWWLLPLVAVSMGLGALAAFLASQRESVQEPSADGLATQPMELGKDERAVWNSTLRNRWFLGLGVLCIASAVPMGMAAHWSVAVLMALIGGLTLAFSGIRAHVDSNGLRVNFGGLPWPKASIRIEDILSASVIDVHPMEWGGWGYRGSLSLMKRAAIVLRAGPGLRLDLADGKTFVVTIDDPQTPAALLNAETQRRVERPS